MMKIALATFLACGLPAMAMAQATVPSIAPPPVPTVPPPDAPHAQTAAPVPSIAPPEVVEQSPGLSAGPAHATPFSGSPATGSDLGTSPVPKP